MVFMIVVCGFVVLGVIGGWLFAVCRWSMVGDVRCRLSVVSI